VRKASLRAGFALFWALALTLPSIAADPPARGRVQTVTRLVKIFLDKEAAIGEAIRSGNAAALGSMLTDDFELRAGARAASPVPREEWMREILRTRDAGGEVSRMAVHDYATVAVASFTQDGPAGALFVVDVWRQQGSDWKLAVRYASPTGAPALAIPGVGPAEPEIPKKY
jgi:hypothetical protein